MPYDDPDATDPLALHGVAVETRDDSAMREMAECFVEEYLRSGFDTDRILQMFRTKGYAGPFFAYETLGENTVRSIIDRQMSLRNPHRSPKVPQEDGGGTISLRVLES